MCRECSGTGTRAGKTFFAKPKKGKCSYCAHRFPKGQLGWSITPAVQFCNKECWRFYSRAHKTEEMEGEDEGSRKARTSSREREERTSPL